MYAIKLELKLNHQKRTLMARHYGYARFCYNLALAIDREVKGCQVSNSKKLRAIGRVFRNRLRELLKDRWMDSPSFRVDNQSIQHLGKALSRFLKVLGGLPKFKRKKNSDSFTLEAIDRERAILSEDSKSIKIPTLGMLISEKYARVRKENLPARGKLADRELTAAISDGGCSELWSQLVYKSSIIYGTTVESSQSLVSTIKDSFKQQSRSIEIAERTSFGMSALRCNYQSRHSSHDRFDATCESS